jgi:hypothetical protein
LFDFFFSLSAQKKGERSVGVDVYQGVVGGERTDKKGINILK